VAHDRACRARSEQGRRVQRTTLRALVQECFGDVIFPGLARFGIDTSLGERWLTERVA
jgi:hypothetical protein